MIGGRELILSSLDMIRNSEVVIHFDNTNAALIFQKGSPKFRLHKYAIEMDDLTLKIISVLKEWPSLELWTGLVIVWANVLTLKIMVLLHNFILKYATKLVLCAILTDLQLM